MIGGPACGRDSIPVPASAGRSPWLLTVLEYSELPLMQAIAADDYKETMLLLACDAEVPAPYDDVRRWLEDIGCIKTSRSSS